MGGEVSLYSETSNDTHLSPVIDFVAEDLSIIVSP